MVLLPVAAHRLGLDQFLRAHGIAERAKLGVGEIADYVVRV